MAKNNDTLVLPDDFSIAFVGELRDQMLTFLETVKNSCVIDGSSVERVDGAGVQLLAALKQAAAVKGMPMQLVNASECLTQAINILGMDEQIN